MSNRTSRNMQVLVALTLIVALLAPVWHTGQAASGDAIDGALARKTADPQAEPPPADLANVPGASAAWWSAVQEHIRKRKWFPLVTAADKARRKGIRQLIPRITSLIEDQGM